MVDSKPLGMNNLRLSLSKLAEAVMYSPKRVVSVRKECLE
jgi:hypothetical protein